VSAALAFAAGCCGLAALHELLAGRARVGMGHAARRLSFATDVLMRLSRDGRDPGAAERRRLLLAGAALALLAGTLTFGAVVGVALAAAGPLAVARALRVRRARYRRAVDAGAGDAAIAIADALGGGHSLRGALAEAARAVAGATGHELRRTGAELATGARTETALTALRLRTASPRLDLLVAACLLCHRSGGDLARLLRESARAFEDEGRLEGEVRAATAQARFTGLLVVLLPLGGALLAELASPGFLAGLASSLLTAWLVGCALTLQVVAGVLIHRLGSVRW
jgi:tight adherence protein B